MKRQWLIVLAASALVLFGCPKPGEQGATGTAGGGGEILVGEYGSMTGNQATFGQDTHNGIMLAMDEINGGGGVNGKKLKVISEDDQSKAEEAANAVTKLISQNGVVAVLGEVASSNSLAAAPICQSNKVPMITPSSTNPSFPVQRNRIPSSLRPKKYPLSLFLRASCALSPPESQGGAWGKTPGGLPFAWGARLRSMRPAPL